jgi:hypothetical protein
MKSRYLKDPLRPTFVNAFIPQPTGNTNGGYMRYNSGGNRPYQRRNQGRYNPYGGGGGSVASAGRGAGIRSFGNRKLTSYVDLDAPQGEVKVEIDYD